MAGIIADRYNLKDELEHGVFVSMLARCIAREMGLDEEMQEKMAITGLIHDIGKLRLANYIHSGDEEEHLEIEQMRYARLHPILSYEIAREYGYPEDVCNFIRWHHENYDGSGYPDQIAGDDIPLGGRIIKVCDVYCALSSDRPYRKRFLKEVAIEMMISEIHHFDMQVFLAFQRVIHSGVVENYKPITDEAFGDEADYINSILDEKEGRVDEKETN